MTDERYNFVPREYWPRLGPAFQGINVNIASIQDDLAALAAGGGGGGGAMPATVPLVSMSPTTRPTTDANVTVLFFTATQPTAALPNDRWFQS